MDIYRLAYWLELLVPDMFLIDGHIFVDVHEVGEEQLKKKISEHATPEVAQRWINIVLIDDFITEVVGDEWVSADASIPKLLSTFERAWHWQVAAKFPGVSCKIETLVDDEYGDLSLRLTNLT